MYIVFLVFALLQLLLFLLTITCLILVITKINSTDKILLGVLVFTCLANGFKCSYFFSNMKAYKDKYDYRIILVTAYTISFMLAMTLTSFKWLHLWIKTYSLTRTNLNLTKIEVIFYISLAFSFTLVISVDSYFAILALTKEKVYRV
jgi:hypothetical protein